MANIGMSAGSEKGSVNDEALQAFEELYIYACPKFISANPPPYEDPELLQAYVEDPPVEPAQRHLALVLVRAVVTREGGVREKEAQEVLHEVRDRGERRGEGERAGRWGGDARGRGDVLREVHRGVVPERAKQLAYRVGGLINETSCDGDSQRDS